jgi:hypothetical protein
MAEEREDIAIEQGAPGAFPTGADVAGPGTVRQGSGYSGTTSGGVEVGAGHDPEPDGPPTVGYMGGTTSEDEPAEEIIDLNPETGE